MRQNKRQEEQQVFGPLMRPQCPQPTPAAGSQASRTHAPARGWRATAPGPAGWGRRRRPARPQPRSEGQRRNHRRSRRPQAGTTREWRRAWRGPSDCAHRRCRRQRRRARDDRPQPGRPSHPTLWPGAGGARRRAPREGNRAPARDTERRRVRYDPVGELTLELRPPLDQAAQQRQTAPDIALDQEDERFPKRVARDQRTVEIDTEHGAIPRIRAGERDGSRHRIPASVYCLGWVLTPAGVERAMAR